MARFTIKRNRRESGYVLIVVILAIAVITIATMIMTERSTNASIFVVRRADSVRAFSMAESAALEGYWRLRADPAYTATNSERRWSNGDWYRFSVYDRDGGNLNVKVRGEGFVDNETTPKTKIILTLSRASTSQPYAVSAWHEDKT